MLFRSSHQSKFEAVVTLDAYAKPFGWYVKEYRFCFPDSELNLEHVDESERIADWAFIEWKAGLNTLIRCQAGLNRSSLITGLILLRERMKVEEAIKTIRKHRGEFALSNESYFNYLKNWKKYGYKDIQELYILQMSSSVCIDINEENDSDDFQTLSNYFDKIDSKQIKIQIKQINN